MNRLAFLILALPICGLAQTESTCPVEIVKLNPSHESFMDNMGTASKYGNNAKHNKFLEVKIKNNTAKTIRSSPRTTTLRKI